MTKPYFPKHNGWPNGCYTKREEGLHARPMIVRPTVAKVIEGEVEGGFEYQEKFFWGLEAFLVVEGKVKY